jgi:hypothetical protein
VLAGLSDELAAHTSPETHAGVVELATGMHHDMDGAVAEPASLRSGLSLELDALVQFLVHLELEGNTSPAAPGAEVLAENRFLAARDGMDARLIDPPARFAAEPGSLDDLVASLTERFLASSELAGAAEQSR